MNNKIITKIGFYSEDDTPDEVFDYMCNEICEMAESCGIKECIENNTEILNSDNIKAIPSPEKIVKSQVFVKRMKENLNAINANVHTKISSSFRPRNMTVDIVSDKFVCCNPRKFIEDVDEFSDGTFSIYLTDDANIGICLALENVFNYYEERK